MSSITFKGKAANHCVVLKEETIQNLSSSGLDITSSEDKNQKFKKGIVQSVGLSCPKKEFKIFGIKIKFLSKDIIKPGDEILLDSYKSSPLTLEGIKYSIIYFQDITIIL